MADQRSSDVLSPPLGAVLGSLNVNLESELNRYRRNRFIEGPSTNDLFADLEADLEADLNAADLNRLEDTIEVSAATLLALPPSLPRNKRISLDLVAPQQDAVEDSTIGSHINSSAVSTAVGSLAKVSTQPSIEEPATQTEVASTSGPASSYLSSSEKLIESLEEVPPMPEPVDTIFRPKRKTVSLMVGATLGFFGLVAGLGASYLMSNPLVAERLANVLRGEDISVATAPESTFDPPGPDLSAREFIDLEIDNLSSLTMPQGTIDPAIAPPTAPTAPASATLLPPIANSPSEQIETQAVVIPAGSNYYVTVPFASEQSVLNIRQTVAEAFVRQFADGNRVQLAAFDQPEAAQQFIEELKAQGITAQIYGPTAE
ncbi:MAG: SPOR domain-containing protein [Phormidesmis sp.]